MADLLDTIELIVAIISGIGGLYYLIFAKKIAEKVKPNSKLVNLSVEERIKRLRIGGIVFIVICIFCFLQLL